MLNLFFAVLLLVSGGERDDAGCGERETEVSCSAVGSRIECAPVLIDDSDARRARLVSGDDGATVIL
jgi:hypothetical protein